MTNLTAIVSSR